MMRFCGFISESTYPRSGKYGVKIGSGMRLMVTKLADFGISDILIDCLSKFWL
jgi:hypothetical protein